MTNTTVANCYFDSFVLYYDRCYIQNAEFSSYEVIAYTTQFHAVKISTVWLFLTDTNCYETFGVGNNYQLYDISSLLNLLMHNAVPEANS